ncbi:MAG: bifunctional diguanylate cyclase/phosphodiesterase [Pseudomonadota bacterium]
MSETVLQTTGEQEPQTVKQRSLSAVLLRRTLVLTLLLGLVGAAVSMWIDLQREKDAVEVAAREFMSSSAPTAAAAVYNFDQEAAEQVAEGLFSQRAIIEIAIINEGDVMVHRTRAASPTLPQIGTIGEADEIVLTMVLTSPVGNQKGEDIGHIAITVDKSLVAPEIVDRLITFFFVTAAKNVLFGLLLFITTFAVLARYTTALAQSVRDWQPGEGGVKVPSPPSLLKNTEVECVGRRIEQLTETASGVIHDIRVSRDAMADTNTALSRHSAELSDAVRSRTSDLEKANAKLKLMSEKDSLTGLYNRAFLDRFLLKAFDDGIDHRKNPLTIFMIDVDHFKPYNDFYGHQAGDEALAAIGRILKEIARSTGCLVARYGGEEFVAVLSGTLISPQDLAKKIHTAIEAAEIEHQYSTVARRITLSIGTASTLEDDFRSADLMISAADDALYEAKLRGRNQTVNSTPEIRLYAKGKRASVHGLLDAIEACEFEPFAQPQVDARTGALVGVEVLARWVRPDGTIIPPNGFMDTATETGLIAKIDGIILEKVGALLSAYPDVLPRVSFNVTGESFEHDKYVSDIVAVAQTSKTPIAVELLETAFMDRPDARFLWQLDTMREAGIEIEIDDFGTGRTSVLGLMSINPDRLKIARELILPLGVRPEQEKLVNSVIDIAKALTVNVIAEGIETREIAQLLTNIGCPIQQGYYHGKPMPLADFIEACAKRRA